jgi:hypothetical protein
MAFHVLDYLGCLQAREQDLRNRDYRSIREINRLVLNRAFDRDVTPTGAIDIRPRQLNDVSKAASDRVHREHVGDAKCGALPGPELPSSSAAGAPFTVFSMHLEEMLEIDLGHSAPVVGDGYLLLSSINMNLDARRNSAVDILKAVRNVFPDDCSFSLKRRSGGEQVPADM